MARKPSKYNNRKVELDGFTFDSQKEARRYTELKLLVCVGQISALELQKSFVLAESVKFNNKPRAKPAIRYVADFAYMENGVMIVEDVKSKATKSLPVYRMKKHLMKSIHDIEIQEI